MGREFKNIIVNGEEQVTLGRVSPQFLIDNPNTQLAPSQPFVRQYDPATDFEPTVQVFRETCDDLLKIEPIWTIGLYIYCRPYLFLEPESCFVLDDGSGKAVGYIIGTSNSRSFCERWKAEFGPAVKDDLESVPNIDPTNQKLRDSLEGKSQALLDLIRSDPQTLIFGSFENELEGYPGHLHIDILPAYQRRGYGRQLIRSFLQSMKGKGCPGVFLGVIASNVNALSFYESVQFKRLPKILDTGASGEMGRTSKNTDSGEQVYFVVDT